MKHLFICIALLFVGLASFSQKKKKAISNKVTSNKEISNQKLDTVLSILEEEFDFKKIPQGKPVQHIFQIVNSGSSSIKLTNVQASCGCTTPEWEKDKEILPGGSSNIKVGYNAAAEGIFTKVITITYNETKTKQITIKGEVWKTPAASAPENSNLNDLKN
jgi:hypothetical protein